MRLYLALCVFGCAVTSAMVAYEGLFIHAAVLSMMGAGLLTALYLASMPPEPTPRPKTWDEYGYNCKPSKCCPGELLVPMHSTDTKLCTGCKTEHPWSLEPGQKRTFD